MKHRKEYRIRVSEYDGEKWYVPMVREVWIYLFGLFVVRGDWKGMDKGEDRVWVTDDLIDKYCTVGSCETAERVIRKSIEDDKERERVKNCTKVSYIKYGGKK